MLFFSKVRSTRLPAVTHVDGSARVQTVYENQNRPLHRLLGAVEARTGIGVLCNTSLNFSGVGFINRMTELEAFCERRTSQRSSSTTTCTFAAEIPMPTGDHRGRC